MEIWQGAKRELAKARFKISADRRDSVSPPSAKTVSKEEVEALEAKRIQRLRELGNWRPSSGWHSRAGELRSSFAAVSLR